ncbi:exodeoxyribonuclease I [Luteibacter rhizovicinus DSM 16549]|uniref:Exodeoxyribonuclease I n=1 Tax=Luteibacter rhizovicinus DSM 16549 TaxID=1440763 RepID=A0A0G9H316_9GAMM|nr:exodeoxyribonuclease I [Luteibacter rhizovicinus]APG06002.1 exodeoxyribonuclease I [Luteibacter rhizovicinus DSM 16549]KLD63963.1 exonuclease I [Luteibacter rhizovicinus DSM 16549]
MAEPTFFWHDYETFGADPRRDRPSQFAGIRTDADLNVVGEPLMIYCKPPRDMPPQPAACLITGIAPQLTEREGMRETEFAAAIHEQLAMPGTCTVGYNSLRFDDEFTRHLLYRNFYDPYGREWENGNSRWDLIDLVRLCEALRPDGIVWPTREDGSASFKLEHLATANGLKQDRAHDALSDVEALIALARLIRQHQPKLWDWYYGLRRKQRVFELLDIAAMTPVVHVSSRYPASRHCLTVIAPLAAHPSRAGEVIVYDLSADPTDLLTLDDGDVADRVFTSRADLPEGVERVALRTVRANQAPALAPLSVLKGVDHGRLGLDMAAVERHLAMLRQADGLAEKLRRIYGHAASLPPAEDAELSLYGGFLPDADRRLLGEVRATPPDQLGTRPFPFRDPRYPELLFRYRARNWPETLSPDEQERWASFRLDRLTRRSALTTLTLDDYNAELATLRALPGSPLPLLDELEAWGLELALN